MSPTKDTFDLLIVGSGSAAFAAAIEATRLGAKVAMAEKGRIGGTCVNIGCVPSKALLAASETYALQRHHPFAGVPSVGGPLDLPLLVAQKDQLVESLRKEKYQDLIEEYGFTFIQGEASFVDEHRLQVGERILRAHRILLATGAVPSIPDIPGLKDVPYLTSTQALSHRKIPETIAIIGAGYVALELGQYFRDLGSRVILFQRGRFILPQYDPEVGKAVQDSLLASGIELYTGIAYRGVRKEGEKKVVVVERQGEILEISADELLVATGRRPQTQALRVEKAGLSLGPRGEIPVDPYLRTGKPHIFAAGDVTLHPQFVYVAAHEGTLAARNALTGSLQPVDFSAVPEVIFTRPAVAKVGITEKEAKAKNLSFRCSMVRAELLARARVNREGVGLFKLVVDREKGSILGAQVVSSNAGDVIYAATLAVKARLTLQDLQETFSPYLTMAEGLKLAALSFDTDVSRLSCCAG
ncbi:MAG: mercury(II) reductase [Clostridiales bacterium]|nr:mercury(II) reductase [Clostridiales bacterium]